ncbi:MAG: sulfite exporter TauE/SafE family protein [Alphaproteobacteria bacterium]|nr:MAG: sulfite exporter TauE/SafE family protein [Alphaproteobacteria bacterium]
MSDFLTSLTGDLLGDLSLWAALGMALAIFVAAILRAFTGFGFALAALPVMSLFLLPTTAVSIVVLLTLTISLQNLKSYMPDVPWRVMGWMTGMAAVGTMLGTYILLVISPDSFRAAIGISVMGACFLLARYKPKDSASGGWKAALTGLASGLLNGALAIPGPPVIIYAMAAFSNPVVSRAFLMGFFLFSAIFATGSYAISGIIGVKELTLFALALPGMLAGNRIGFRLFEKYGSGGYRRIALMALFAIGLSVTLSGIF